MNREWGPERQCPDCKKWLWPERSAADKNHSQHCRGEWIYEGEEGVYIENGDGPDPQVGGRDRTARCGARIDRSAASSGEEIGASMARLRDPHAHT